MPPRHTRHPWALRVAAALSVIAAALFTAFVSTGAADLQGRISTAKNAAAALRNEISADSSQIESTNQGIVQAEARLSNLQSSLDRRVGELKTVQGQLLASRDRLIQLENRLHLATRALSANLVAGYEGAQPNLVTVILDSHGFKQLLNQINFMHRMGHQDASIVTVTRIARREVSGEAKRLGALERRDRALAEAVLHQRNQVAALQAALQHERVQEIARRARTAGNYHAVQARIGVLQHKLNVQEAKAAAAARRAAQTGNAGVGGIAINTNGYVQAPANAPEAVKQMIAAGNAIATLPYIWGGGHASFQANGYDCSGSVSYVLAAAGLISAPEVSGDFESYGDPGNGQWVSIYANAGHVWMTIAGWRFDTVALAQYGTRWSRGGGEFSGFVVRHPPGL
ncbi:MAG: coiled-coil domain-containing protein [Solirubrobacteraceae bacterium]